MNNMDATLEEMERIFGKAQRDINHELPRKIFKGKTSQEIYDATPDYDEGEDCQTHHRTEKTIP